MKLSREKNRIWRYVPMERFSVMGMKKVGKDAFINRLNAELGTLSDTLFCEIDKEEGQSILTWANHTLKHEFDYLGSGIKHLEPIAWHSDFKGGYTWPKDAFYRDINVDFSIDKYDGKVPWELSRCHHLLWLGGAFRIAHDQKFASEIRSEIEDWIVNNPLMQGVNWVCTMDVAIRAVNWIYAIWLIQDSTVLTEEFMLTLENSLYQHGFFISNHLERVIPYSNNHYTSNLVGLLFLGAVMKKTSWYRIAKKALYDDIRQQILSSGVQYERSLSYHRLVIEMLSSSFYLLVRRGEQVPSDIVATLRKMYRFINEYTKPNGNAPLVEDNDDGRFLPFVRRDFRYHAYLLNPQSVENRVFGNGVELLTADPHTASYEDAGYWIHREGEAYLLVTNGGQSRKPVAAKRVGTHTHNDLLSFELAVGDDDIIIDPGTYQYMFSQPEGRNDFRSTRKHNTVIVDGEEQHFLSNTSLFVIEKNAVIDTAQSYHTESGLKHKRVFDLKEGELFVCDTIHKEGDNHQLMSFFHFAPDVKISTFNDEIKLETTNYKGCVSFNTELQPRFLLKDDTVSPSYGVLRKSKTVVFEADFSQRATVETYIHWERK